MKQATARDVKNYLDHLSDLKKSIKFPMNMEIDGNLYIILDGDGQRVAAFTEEIYKIFQEL